MCKYFLFIPAVIIFSFCFLVQESNAGRCLELEYSELKTMSNDKLISVGNDYVTIGKYADRDYINMKTQGLSKLQYDAYGRRNICYHQVDNINTELFRRTGQYLFNTDALPIAK